MVKWFSLSENSEQSTQLHIGEVFEQLFQLENHFDEYAYRLDQRC